MSLATWNRASCSLVWLALVASVGWAADAMSVDRGEAYLSARHRRLVYLQQRGIDHVLLHVAAEPAHTAAIAAELARRGGDVRFRVDEIGYLRVSFPFRQPGEVDALLAIAGVEAVDASWTGMDFSWPMEMRALRPPVTPPPPGNEDAGPVLRPHLAITDMDGDAFRRAHPTFDGRGVVIGQVEGDVPDLLHPNLQRALSMSGEPRPKFAVIARFEDRASQDFSRGWVDMARTVTASAGRFLCEGEEFVAPRDGAFQFGRLPRASLAATNFVPVIGHANDESLVFPILWDVERGTVWVDTDLDRSFKDEQPLRAAALTGDVGFFGGRDAQMPRPKPVAFFVAIDRAAEKVRVMLGARNAAALNHPTWTAGSAAGEGFNDGAFDAVAGKAQLALFGYLPAMKDDYLAVDALRAALNQPSTDVIFHEDNGYISDLYALVDGGLALSIALERLAARSGKPVFITAGNSWGLTSLADPSVGAHLISVSAYNSGDALRTNFAADSAYRDNLHAVGSWGPAGNGRLKPDLLAPSGHVTTKSRLDTTRWGITGSYVLPPAYQLGNGTSCAAPTAAAAAALLISAAKQSHVKCDSDRLRFALYSTARVLEGIPMYQQGRGLIQIGAAWDALVRLNAQPNWIAPNIEVDAPVKTAVSQYFHPADRGAGLFEREGWAPGQTGRRVIRLTRRNGATAPVRYDVEWTGDVAAFRGASTVTLPLNATVDFPVDVTTREARVYSAMLRLREPGAPVESLSLAATIVAAEPLDPTKDGATIERVVTVRRPGNESVWIAVPAGLSALHIVLEKDSAETITLNVLDPMQRNSGLAELKSGRAEAVVENPIAGAWELNLDNRKLLLDVIGRPNGGPEPRPHPLTPTSVRVRVEAIRLQRENPPVRNAADEEVALILRNDDAALARGVASVALATEREEHGTLTPGEAQTFRLTIPTGARHLRVELDRVVDPGARIGVTIFQLYQGTPYNRKYLENANGVMVHGIDNPATGEWRVVVDPLNPAAGAQAFTLRTVVSQPSLGSVALEASAFAAPAGGEIRLRAKVTAASHPSAPERLVALWSLSTTADASAPKAPTPSPPFAQFVSGVP
jgi:hypothetical protein